MATAKRNTGRKLLVFALILAVLGGLGAWAYFHKREVILTVQTEKAALRSLTEVVGASGKIQPVLMVKISPEVSGEIIDLPVKEGQRINKGDLLMKIKPDFYTANRNSAQASHKSSLANVTLAKANLDKAQIEFKRNKDLFESKLISEQQFQEAKTTLEVNQSQVKAAEHQTEVAAAALARAEEELSKTTIFSPLSGTISKLNSQPGERVVGTATMAGTDVMTIADLTEMEARVDVGETDVVLICIGQTTRLEVDSYRDKKFTGTVTEIANTAKSSGAGTQQEATKFEVRIRVKEKELFRPGMSVTAEIETRSRSNVLAIPIQSVTTRLGKGDDEKKKSEDRDANADAPPKPGEKAKKQDNASKPVEVVFLAAGDTVKMVKVKRGISDDTYVEITEGLTERQEIVSGGYKAINRELEEGKKIKVDNEKKKPAVEKK